MAVELSSNNEKAGIMNLKVEVKQLKSLIKKFPAFHKKTH